MSKIYNYFVSPRRASRDLSTNIFITILLAFVFTLINPNFIGNYNLVSIGQNLAPYALLSLGVLIPISMGGIDLSVGATCIASAVVAGKLYSIGMPLWGVIPVMIVFGGLVGCINGFCISKYNIPPFIVTLGSMMFIRGLSAIIANSPTVLYPSDCWYNRLFSNYNGFPISFVWVAVFAVLIYLMYRKTKWGRYLVSIGSNEKATRISGVDVTLYKNIGYILSGLMAGIAGIFWSASFATLTVATGNGMELDAIAGVYIGGTSALGGMANVFGSVIGSIMLVVVRSGLNFALAKLDISINSTYVTYVISGIIVVAAVLLERTRDRSFKLSKKEKRDNEKKLVVKKCFSLAVSFSLVIFLILASTNAINISGVSNNKNQKTICLLMKSEGSDFWNTLTQGATAAGADYGYRVICRGPEAEDPSYLPKQLEIAESLLSESPAGMGISAIADGFSDYLKKINKEGIPAVQYDSGLFATDVANLDGSSDSPLKSYIKADNYANAALAAEKSFEAVKTDIIKSDEYIVGIIQHENSETSAKRSNGFADKFKELAEANPETAGKVTVYIEVKPSSADNAYKAGLEFLFEKDVKLVFGTAEPVLTQLIDAINASNGKYDGVKFAGYDVGEKVKEWLNSDSHAKLLGTINQDPYMLGYLTVETLIKLSQGEEVPEEVIVPGVWVTGENEAG